MRERENRKRERPQSRAAGIRPKLNLSVPCDCPADLARAHYTRNLSMPHFSVDCLQLFALSTCTQRQRQKEKKMALYGGTGRPIVSFHPSTPSHGPQSSFSISSNKLQGCLIPLERRERRERETRGNKEPATPTDASR